MNPSEIVDALIRGEDASLTSENILPVLEEAINRLIAIRRNIKVEEK